MLCLSSAGSVGGARCSVLIVAIPCDCAPPGGGVSPTRLRNDCDNPGAKLAMATPAMSARTERGRRPIMRGAPAHHPLGSTSPLRVHQPGSLKVFGDGLELAYDRACRTAPAVCRCVEAVIDVIVNQRFFASPTAFSTACSCLARSRQG